LKYADSIELVKLFSNPVSTECLNFSTLDLDIRSEFLKNAPPSYFYDLASFLGSIQSALSIISNGDMNVLRFMSTRALESTEMLMLSMRGPIRATADYVNESINDILRCKNCFELTLQNASMLSSATFRKLNLQLTKISLSKCEILTDDDFAWYLTANKDILTHFCINGSSCTPIKTFQALRQCTAM